MNDFVFFGVFFYWVGMMVSKMVIDIKYYVRC